MPSACSHAPAFDAGAVRCSRRRPLRLPAGLDHRRGVAVGEDGRTRCALLAQFCALDRGTLGASRRVARRPDSTWSHCGACAAALVGSRAGVGDAPRAASPLAGADAFHGHRLRSPVAWSGISEGETRRYCARIPRVRCSTPSGCGARAATRTAEPYRCPGSGCDTRATLRSASPAASPCALAPRRPPPAGAPRGPRAALKPCSRQVRARAPPRASRSDPPIPCRRPTARRPRDG